MDSASLQANLGLVPLTQPTYCCQKRRGRVPLQVVPRSENIGVLCMRILTKSMLCPHDVEDLNRAYRALDLAERKPEKENEESSLSSLVIFQAVIDKVKNIVSEHSKDPRSVISLYHLQNFAEKDCGIEEAFNRLQGGLTDQIKLQIAKLIPSCISVEKFNKDMKSLIGPQPREEVERCVKKKRALLVKDKACKVEIERKKAELRQLQKLNPQKYPVYLNQLLENGFLHLYNHLVQMKNFATRNERRAAIDEMTFSDLSHVVLETRKAIIQRVKKAIPSNHADSTIFFLLGSTRAGKSTTLSFLRGDEMVCNGDYYTSKSDQENLIGQSESASCTFLPNVEIVLNQRVLVDYPGFDDTNSLLVSLGMELALKALITRYQPKILILESIMNTNNGYASVAELGRLLDRLIEDKTGCVLGITKYSQYSKYKDLRALEERQRRDLSRPSEEEEDLRGDIRYLERRARRTPDQEKELEEMRIALAGIQRKKMADQLLPDTEEKTALKQKIKETEEEILRQTGLRYCIRLSDLEKPDRLDACLNELNALPMIRARAKEKPESCMDIETERCLNDRFEKNLQAEIGARKNYHLDFDSIWEFEQAVWETSLTNTITPWSPEIGQFLHLPEMDPNIVKSYDKKIVRNSIESYMEAIISSVQFSKIKAILTILKKDETQKKIVQLKHKVKKLKDYVAGLKGFGDLSEEELMNQWITIENRIREARKTAAEGVGKDYALGFWATFGLALPIGVPLGIYRLVEHMQKFNAGMAAEQATFHQIVQESTTVVDQLYEQLLRLREIERIIEKQDEIETVFHSTRLNFESVEKLRLSITETINQIKDIYGSDHWESRVAHLRDSMPWISKLRYVEQRIAIVSLLFDQNLSLIFEEKLCDNFDMNIASVRRYALGLRDRGCKEFTIINSADIRLVCLEPGLKSDLLSSIDDVRNLPIMAVARRLLSIDQDAGSERQEIELDLRTPLAKVLLAAALLQGRG